MPALLILAACAVVLLLWAWHFPHPSPLIRPLLPAKRRWPEAQIRQWLATDRVARGFRHFFERDPERRVPSEPGLLAPADGLITSLDVRDDIRYVVIALSFWDVHVQRSPCDGVIEAVEEQGDTFMDGEGREFAFLRAKTCPVQKRVRIRSTRGLIALRLITSLAARRIEVWYEPGTTVVRGQRLGRILLGSTVVLEMPAQWPCTITVGQRVCAGETLVEPAQAGVA
ncbi:phosphatidylserine decarboxylase [Acidihalobacter ferrooxydans]|uniref:Phosphatidylserine decarboxylase n=1 Tax=Acidihalobacter ferrooxydans TaxID=1765967 RepID=A0A1P8ULF5_9GAMM|nr:phosphatidylserine decarboxylase [Acidihalobacter ferrooxydans]APZ44676.1 phosphatidylserine decarboxylase [Acidihalobacter ferrooxydans]